MKISPDDLLENLKRLSSRIASKPANYTTEWARTIDDAFEKYTNTRTINLLKIANICLIDAGWPFPAYLDLEKEYERFLKRKHMWGAIKTPPGLYSGKSDIFSVMLFCETSEPNKKKLYEAFLVRLLRKNLLHICTDLKKSSYLTLHTQLIDELHSAYQNKLWGVFSIGVMSLTDAVMRGYFSTDNLRTSVSDIVRGFREAKLKPEDLMPGYTMTSSAGNTLAGIKINSPGNDLRLVGIYLSSFLEFAEKYYQWCDIAKKDDSQVLNRHSLIHGATQLVTEADAAKMLTFLDQVVRLQKPLTILIQKKLTQ